MVDKKDKDKDFYVVNAHLVGVDLEALNQLPIDKRFQEYRRLRDEWEKKNRKMLQQRKRNAINKSKRIAKLLKEKYGAEAVYLFGSAAGQGWGEFTEQSDIDVMVFGIKGVDYLNG